MRRAVCFALIAALITAGCSVISVDFSPRIRPLHEETVEGHGLAKIVLVDLSGFIAEEGAPSITIGSPPPRVPLLVRFREELKKAADDTQVKGLVLRINSAGGTVTASDILYRELDLFRREKKVPIVAVLMDVAASGGYYVALGADQIVAHPTTVTGSIGVILLTVNTEGLMQKIGVAATPIKSGERKDMGSPFRTATPEERAIFQGVIDSLHAQFVAKVVERRKLTPESVRLLADGRIYTAEQALGQKLIDGIGYMPDAIEVVKRAADVKDARVVVYHRPREYRATYYARSEAETGSLPAALAPLGTLMGAGPRFLYLWSP